MLAFKRQASAGADGPARRAALFASWCTAFQESFISGEGEFPLPKLTFFSAQKAAKLYDLNLFFGRDSEL